MCLRWVVFSVLLSTAGWAQLVPPVPPQPPTPPSGGLSPERARQVQALTFDAQEVLSPLEAEWKRAQLELDRALADPVPDEAAVMKRLEAVARAELAVKKNRLGLQLRLRKLLGAAGWQRLQSEQPPVPGVMFTLPWPATGAPAPEVRRIAPGDFQE